MKKHTTIWLLLLVLSLFAACKKENPKLTVIKGEVKNALTGELVSDIPINIFECEGGFYLGADRCGPFKTFYTDITGHFSYSFESKKQHFYKIGIGVNDKIPGTAYPGKIISNQENVFNFSEKPLKILQLKVKILRHDKNWVYITTTACSGNYWRYDFYFGMNPQIDFDTAYNIKIEAGRQYLLVGNLSNKIADYTYQNDELFKKYFFIENVDTTKIEFVIQ